MGTWINNIRGIFMKKSLSRYRLLVSSITSLVFTAVLLGTVSYAWLSMNKQTQSNGIMLKVEVTPNIIIDADSGHIITVAGPSEASYSHTFSDAAKALRPTTHDDDYTTYANGLKYVTNTENVGASSGVVKSGALAYSSAVNTPSTTYYYVDYVVYIASTGKAMDGQDLVATLEPAATIANSNAVAQDTLKAASIDFYAGSGDIDATSSTFIGTLNVAGFDADLNDHSTPKTSLTLISNNSIPHNQAAAGNKYITVIMRCYIDGALLKDSGQAFINAATVVTDDITLNVKFAAADYHA